MSTKAPSRLEFLAVCKHHLAYYHARANEASNRSEYGIATAIGYKVEALEMLRDVLTGKKPPLGVRVPK